MSASPVIHEWEAKRDIETVGAAELDRLFDSLGFDVEEAHKWADLRGIDRVMTHRDLPKRVSVEYKCCDKAHVYGNVFVEVVSNDRTNRKGWVWTCIAQHFVYYAMGLGKVMAIETAAMRRLAHGWLKRYEIGKAPNKGYMTHGIKVPVPVFEKCCQTYEAAVIVIED